MNAEHGSVCLLSSLNRLLKFNRSSSIADMVVQSCTIQIFTVKCNVPLFNALFLSNV